MSLLNIFDHYRIPFNISNTFLGVFMDIKLAIMGGDRRQSSLAERMVEYGATVSVYGTPTDLSDVSSVNFCQTYEDALDGADAIILPLPVSGDGVYLSCPTLDSNKPRLCEIFRAANGRPILGGRFSPTVKSEAERLGARLLDYFDSEELKVRNSVLASEGAVSVAMNELDVAIFGSRCAITGYGRLAKTLAPMLRALGAEVTVAARKSIDIAWAAAYGFDTLRIGVERDGSSTLTSLCKGYDVIFNTVPYWLFDRDLLEKLSSKTLIVDLASAPGGFDSKAAEEYGTRTIRALSIPGRYAPVSAGRLIAEFVVEILKRENIM